MSQQSNFRNFTSSILHKFFSVDEKKDYKLSIPRRVLIVRQHNQFGDLLASVSLFRAVKETYPECKITLIASPENHFAVEKNTYIDKLFVFNKRRIFNPLYFIKVINTLRQKFDLAIVPATVAISKTSCILAAISDAEVRVGPKSLDGEMNPADFVLHYRIDLNWKKCPDAHVSDFILDIVRPFGIKTKNYSSSIVFDQRDEKIAEDFISTLNVEEDNFIIGFHIGAGKPQNRWPLEKFIKLIYLLGKDFSLKIYFTGSDADIGEINYVRSNLSSDAGYFLNKTIPQLAALISKSNLFVTNDTGVMHVAGTTKTPQISIFGPTNPFNWAPVGPTKYFLRKSELIGDVEEEEVYNLCKYIFEKSKK